MHKLLRAEPRLFSICLGSHLHDVNGRPFQCQRYKEYEMNLQVSIPGLRITSPAEYC